jgi:AhpD family alkylhydroperoxidase
MQARHSTLRLPTIRFGYAFIRKKSEFLRNFTDRFNRRHSMSRFQPIDPTKASGKANDLLEAVRSKLGRDFSMTSVMANSAAVLGGYLNFSGALSGGALSPKLREEIALVPPQQNCCNYCLSAHNAIGKMVGLSADQVIASRKRNGESPKVTAALKFATRVLETKGQVSESDLAAVVRRVIRTVKSRKALPMWL